MAADPNVGLSILREALRSTNVSSSIDESIDDVVLLVKLHEGK
jgi:hypothetical protein